MLVSINYPNNSKKLLKMTKLIGLCGTARCGKDTFFNFAESRIPELKNQLCRVAFADELKKDLFPFLMEKMNINPWTSIDKEKALIRPIMVAYGEAMREKSNGTYWIDKISKKVKENLNEGKISVITDVRYKNEIDYLLSHEDAKCLYIERMGIKPANKEEEFNDPDLRKNSNHILKWKTFGDKEIEKCIPIIKSCLKNLKVI